MAQERNGSLLALARSSSPATQFPRSGIFLWCTSYNEMGWLYILHEVIFIMNHKRILTIARARTKNCDVPLVIQLDFQIYKLSMNIIDGIRMGKMRRFYMHLYENLFHFISKHFSDIPLLLFFTCRDVFFDPSPLVHYFSNSHNRDGWAQAHTHLVEWVQLTSWANFIALSSRHTRKFYLMAVFSIYNVVKRFGFPWRTKKVWISICVM